MDLLTRKDAHTAGKLNYFTGKPCIRGHILQRNVASGACLGCLAEYAKQYRHKMMPKNGGLTATLQEVLPAHVSHFGKMGDLFRLAATNNTEPPAVPHYDDVAAVNTLVAMLWSARGVTPPPPPVKTTPYEMWVRIHGKTIADQMVANGY